MQYDPNLKSLRKHVVPDWFHDAKLGIFIHWGLFSVPAFAPPDRGDSSEIIVKEGWETYYHYNPYAEWYVNSMKLPGSPTAQYHEEHYDSNFPYEDFQPQFDSEIKKWNPTEWVDLFKAAGARYVVLTSKHMDGFLLWPSKYRNPKKTNYIASRNIVGELFAATRAQGLKMGLYYCGVMDDAWYPSIIRDMGEFITHVPPQREYAEYVDNQYYELIDTYQPDILWNDIGYPADGKVFEVLAYYYNHVPEGLINDRWAVYAKWIIKGMKWKFMRKLADKLSRKAFAEGKTGISTKMHADYTTPEYVTLKEIAVKKWECVRGIGRSFGYNAMEEERHYLSETALIHLLVDVVSKNGNLLLNVGPMADGTIPLLQQARLRALGQWLNVNGEGIFGTRSWTRATSTTTEMVPVRFTQTPEALFSFVLAVKFPTNNLTIENLEIPSNATLQLLGMPDSLHWEQVGKSLRIKLPDEIPCRHALALKISPKPLL